MKKFVMAILLFPMLLAGCSQAKINQDIHSGPYRPNWISSYHSGKPTEYYVVTGEKVTKAGEPFYNFSNALSHGPGGWTSTDPNAVQLLSIPGVAISKAVAVKLKNGFCVKATSVGNQKP